jgi:hypothetical protein
VFEREVAALREAEGQLATRDAVAVARDAAATRETITRIAAGLGT